MIKKTLPKRKHPRLKHYDYSAGGYYFVTVCAKDNKCLFGRVLPENRVVGRGLAPAERQYFAAIMRLSDFGLIAERQLEDLESRYSFLTVDEAVIMPNHIHILFKFKSKTAGASPRPTLSDVLCAYKSLTVRECHKITGKTGNDIFQDSFYESVIQDEKSYFNILRYIDENPMNWIFDEYYISEV